MKCGSCDVLLMYPYGASSVRCSSCRFVTEIGVRLWIFASLFGLFMIGCFSKAGIQEKSLLSIWSNVLRCVWCVILHCSIRIVRSYRINYCHLQGLEITMFLDFFLFLVEVRLDCNIRMHIKCSCRTVFSYWFLLGISLHFKLD